MPAAPADVWKELKSKVNLVYYLGPNRLKILEDSFNAPTAPTAPIAPPVVKKTLANKK